MTFAWDNMMKDGDLVFFGVFFHRKEEKKRVLCQRVSFDRTAVDFRGLVFLSRRQFFVTQKTVSVTC